VADEVPYCPPHLFVMDGNVASDRVRGVCRKCGATQIFINKLAVIGEGDGVSVYYWGKEKVSLSGSLKYNKIYKED